MNPKKELPWSLQVYCVYIVSAAQLNLKARLGHIVVVVQYAPAELSHGLDKVVS